MLVPSEQLTLQGWTWGQIQYAYLQYDLSVCRCLLARAEGPE